jgi:hypothetical protein
MRTFAGMGLVLAGQVTAAGGLGAALRLRTRRKQLETAGSDAPGAVLRFRRESDAGLEHQVLTGRPGESSFQYKTRHIPDHVSTVLEIEPIDAVLPSAEPPAPIPEQILAGLRDDPLLGLAEVRLLQHVQPTGAGLPERSQAGASYQRLNQDIAHRLGTEPIPATRLTWLTFRLELPGSRRHALAARAAGPILARGGGITGARRTLDKAARTASAKLALVGYRTTTLAEGDYHPGFGSDLAVTRECSTAAPAGVLIGVDPAHRPVTVGLFRRTTLSAAVIGGLYLAQILALRCAAVGARIIVETARQDEWDPVLLYSGLDEARLAVQPVGRPVGHPGWPAPSMAAPLLVLRDCGARPPYAAVPRGPWTANVTLLPYFDPRTAGYLRDADLVGLQRMPREEAAMMRHVLALPDKDTAALADLPDPMVLWRSRKRTMRYCEFAPTKWEEAFLGEPER